jgi:hypothetical protein
LQSKTYVLNRAALSDELQKHVVHPYLQSLKEESRSTLNGMRKKCSDVAQKVVEDALTEEDRRFTRERDLKALPSQGLSSGLAAPSFGLAAASLTIHLNLLAAESGLVRLREHLIDSCFSAS